MRCTRASTLLILIGLAAPVPLVFAGAQAPPPPADPAAGKLSLTTNSSQAKAEFWDGLEDWQTGAYTNGVRHFRRAYALDNSFALARVFAMGENEARQHPADLDRAVGDAARQSAQEGVLALVWREKALGHFAQEKALLRAAMQMLPNEAAPAVEYLWASTGDGTNPKQARDSARAFRARFPSSAPVAFAVAYLTMNAGDTAEAFRAAEEFTRTAPSRGVAFGYFGSLLQQAGRYDDAAAQFRKGMATPTHPDYGWDPASSLAEMYFLRGRYADAREVATEALAKATDAADSAMYLAEIAGTSYATGDNRRAMQLLQQAREKNATVGSAQNPIPLDYILAEAGALTGDLASMRSYLGRATPQTANDSAILLAQYADDYAYAGQLDSVMVYSDRLAKLSSVPWAAGAAHHTRGVALASVKQCARARTEFAQAPDSSGFELQFTRADCEFQLGNRAAAVALRDRAIASQEFALFDAAYVLQRIRLAQMK
jgi:tetratricopeptide (TPR) repeat protein